MRTPWEDLGVPRGYADPRLLYNEPSNTLILEVKPEADGRAPVTLVLTRKAHESRYAPWAGISPDFSCEDVVSAESVPFAYFNAITLTPHREDSGFSGDWTGVYRVDLNTGEANLAISQEMLSGAMRHSERDSSMPGPFISHLHAVSADGARVTASIGIPHGTVMKYQIYVLNLDPLSIASKIGDLPGTFF